MKIGTLNLKYYLMLPWKRPQLKIDAITSAIYANGRTKVTFREFYNLTGFVRYYSWEFKQWLKRLIRSAWGRRLHFEVLWLPALQFAGTDLELKLPHISFAIAVDSTGSGGTGSGTSFSWSHTCSGSSRTMVFSFQGLNSDTGTYNSVALTQDAQVGALPGAYLGHLLSPATGTHTASIGCNIFNAGQCGSISFTGSQGVGAHNTNSVNPSDNIGVSVTTTVANGYVVDSMNNNRNSTGSLGTSQTAIVNGVVPGGNGWGVASYKATTTAGSYTMFETDGAANNAWVDAILEVQPGTQITTSVSTANGVPQASIASTNGEAIAGVSTIYGVPNV